MEIAITFLISYVLGCFSTSYIVAKKMTGKDIRTMGSGNAGSTNVLRSLGKKAGAITFAGDMLKGVIAVVISGLIANKVGADPIIFKSISVIGVVCGHIWPAHMKFKGGKGIATAFGAMLALSPLTSLLSLAVFIVVVAISKYVSLGSITCIICSPIIAFFVTVNHRIVMVCMYLALAIIYSHRNNIAKLLNKTESKITDKKKPE